jgi:hypothetical protein
LPIAVGCVSKKSQIGWLEDFLVVQGASYSRAFISVGISGFRLVEKWKPEKSQHWVSILK